MKLIFSTVPVAIALHAPRIFEIAAVGLFGSQQAKSSAAGQRVRG